MAKEDKIKNISLAVPLEDVSFFAFNRTSTFAEHTAVVNVNKLHARDASFKVSLQARLSRPIGNSQVKPQVVELKSADNSELVLIDGNLEGTIVSGWREGTEKPEAVTIERKHVFIEYET